MKKIYSILAVILLVLMAAGCSSNADNEKTAKDQTGTTETQTDGKQQESQSDEETADSNENMSNQLSSGSEKVITVLEKLKTNLETNAENSEVIQTTGKDLEESWDAIEKNVEENYPEDYENIEESLYPLISEAQKDKPDTTAIKKLMNETKEKMEAFKEKIGS
ncbi:hypothetical protein [Neobacillus mesonae]|uniref:Lipoprotein n=1 Tax=Neobacillus mesonae TaxID=1193713 RepID=A0A3T0I522_9BACI|nr:hypothetical protein [Neobacillus mesonae]AZU64439.1 hypothetical protein CHR53_26185 [Neobacillus mesonae]